MSNEDVRDYLWEYQRKCDEIADLRDEIEELMSRSEKITSTLSDMPKGNGKSGFEDVAIKYLGKCEKLDIDITEAEKTKIEIKKTIRKINDYRIEKVIIAIYIKKECDKGQKAETVEKMGYSLRHFDRLHAEGIRKLKDVLKCH